MRDLIAIVAAVISLGAACAAWIRARRAEYLSASTGTTGLLLNVNRAFVDNPEAWKYFTQGLACPGDRDHDYVRAIANILEAIQSENASPPRVRSVTYDAHL